MIFNLTQHVVRIVDVDGNVHDILPSGTVATVSVTMTATQAVTVEGLQFAVNRREFGQVQNLPEQQPGSIYIVSAMVKDRILDRPDVFAPDTGPTAIRKDGQVWGVLGLVK